VRSLVAIVTALGLAASAPPLLPRAFQAANLLLHEDDPVRVAEFQLRSKTASDYENGIRSALAKPDADLAASLRDLAGIEGVMLSPTLLDEVKAAEKAAQDATIREAWEGFLSGQAPTEPALAGAVAADLTGFGDVRDLYRQGKAYAAGETVDRITVALAAVGVGMTAVTAFSLVAALPGKAGVSTLKAAHRAGRISPALTRHMSGLAREAVDPAALQAFSRSLRAFDMSGIRTAARSILRPGPAASIRALGDDVSTLGTRAGYRGTLDVLAHADDAADVARKARLSERYGHATRGALTMLAHGAMTLSSVLVAVLGWLSGALVWVLALLLFLLRVSRALFRAAQL